MKSNKTDRIRVLPKVINNEFKGLAAAKYVFALITIVTIARSLIHMFAADGGAQSIVTIPLDTFTQAGAAVVVMTFSLWGLAQLLMGVVYGVVFIKYKSLIPFMYILLIVEYALRIVISVIKPIETTGTAPGAVGNFILIPLCVIMLVLSMIKSKKYREA